MTASGIDGLLSCIECLLSPDASIRQHAERGLEEAERVPGCGLALAEIAQSPGLSLDLRQLAALLLRTHIRKHWTDESPAFCEPPMTAQEKAALRAALPPGLADPVRKLRTATGMAIAAVAKWDCPEAWPELLPGMLAVLAQKPSAQHVDGTIRCLDMFLDELGEDQVLELAPGLLTQLAPLLGPGSNADSTMARRVLSILRVVVGALQTMAGTHRAGVKAMLPGVVAQWAPILAAVLEPSNIPELWPAQREAMRVLTTLVSSFSRLVSKTLVPVLGVVWTRLVAGLPQYHHLVVLGNEPEDQSPGDGDLDDDDDRAEPAVALEALVSQTLELVLSVVCSPRLHALLAPNLQHLFGLVIAYAALPAAALELWEDSPDQAFLDEEIDTTTVRAACEMLADETLEACEDSAMMAFSAAFWDAMTRSDAARAGGDPDWWRAREAALLLAGCVLEGGRAAPRRAALDLHRLLAVMQEVDLAPGAPACLTGRALWLAARLAGSAPRAARLALLGSAVANLTGPPAARGGACRAVAALAGRVGGCGRVAGRGGAGTMQEIDADVAGLVTPMFEGLGRLLGDAGEEGLSLVLETVRAVVCAFPEQAGAWEGVLSPAVLAVWEAHPADPLLGTDAKAVLGSLALSPNALPALRARMLPALARLLRDPWAAPTTLLDDALEFLVLLTRPGGAQPAAALHAALSMPVLALAMRHDDAEVLATCCAYFRTLLQVGGAVILSTPVEGLEGPVLPALIQALIRLLGTDLLERAAVNVGGVILELLRADENQIAPFLPDLLRALCSRLASAEAQSVVQSLLVVLAELARHRPDDLISCLAGIQLKDGSSALVSALDRWSRRQTEILDDYDMRLTASALGMLLLSGHPALAAVTVRGRRLEAQVTGVRTRARAAAAPDRWSEVPLKSKLLQLLVKAYSYSTALEVYDFGSSNASEDEDVDASDDEAGTSAGRRSYNGIQDLLGAGDLEDSDNPLVDPLEAARRKGDSLSRLDLPAHLRQVVTQYSVLDPKGCRAACQELGDLERQTFQQMVM